MPVLNNVKAIPTGGVIGITLTTATSGNIVLSRATSGVSGLSAFTTLYSGSPLSETGETMPFLDIGDGTPGPLLNGVLYVYQLTDVDGTVQSDPIATPSAFDIEQIDYTEICIAIIQGAINTANLPNGVRKATVFQAMPLAGAIPLPMLCFNPDLVAQEYTEIGEDEEVPGDLIQPPKENVWTQPLLARRLVRITVMSDNPSERDYYRDFVIGTLRISMAYAFSLFGADVSHSYEAASYQDADQTNLMIPGFYAADVLFDFVAQSNVKVTTNYQLFETITAAVSGGLSADISMITNTIVSVTSGGTDPVVTTIQVPRVSG